MTSLDDRLRREFNEATPPAIETRDELAATRAKGRRAQHRRRALAAGGVFTSLAMLVGVGFAQRRASDTPRTDDLAVGRQVTAATPPSAEPPMWSWTKIDDAPIAGRYGHVSIWTGEEMLVWGGSISTGPGTEAPARDGAAFNPATRTWRRIADAPITIGYQASAVWTGREMVVWGLGVDEKLHGAAYDPAADRWREIASAPLSPRWATGTAWTGSEMVVWGGATRNPVAAGHAADGAAYDPVTDRWRLLPAAPIGRRSGPITVWTGRDVVIGGGESGDGGTHDWAAYSPSTNEWRPLPDPPIDSSFVYEGSWIDGKVMFWSGVAGAALDPEAGSWTEVAKSPTSGVPVTAVVRDEVVAWGDRNNKSDTGARFEPSTARWTALPSSPLTPRAGQSLLAANGTLLIWGGFGDLGSHADGAIGQPTPTPVRQTGQTQRRVLPTCAHGLATISPPSDWARVTTPGDGNTFAGDPHALSHWGPPSRHPGIYVNVLDPDNAWLPLDTSTPTAGETVDIPGATAVFHEVHEAYAIAVTYPSSPPCGYVLMSGSISKEDFVGLAKGIYLTDDPAGAPTFDSTDSIWPEESPDDLTRNRSLLEGRQEWRLSATETLTHYASDELGWTDVRVPEGGGEPSEDGRFGSVMTVEGKDSSGKRRSTVAAVARLVGGRWHSVYRDSITSSTTGLVAVDWTSMNYPDCGGRALGTVLVFREPQVGVHLAIVRVTCIADAGSPPSAILVYDDSGPGGQPHLLQTLLEYRDNWLPKDDSVVADKTTFEIVVQGYSAGTPRCCPDVKATLGWKWDGRRYQVTRSQPAHERLPA